MTTLTDSQLIALLSKPGMHIVGMLTETDSKARKTSNPFPLPVVKRVRCVGMVGANYEGSVNREATRQDAAPTFHAESLPWGEWYIPNKVISHKGEYYLRTQTTPGTRRKSACRVLYYRDASGKYVSKSDIQPYLPVAKESNKQQVYTGMEETVWVRTYAFKSIVRIRLNGITYKLVRDGMTPTSPNWENTDIARLTRD